MIKCLFKCIVFTLLVFIYGSNVVNAQTCSSITSNTTPDAGYNLVVWVTSTSDANTSGTLRWAINQANANTGAGTMIKFCFDQAGDILIQLTSELPNIVKKVKIDGSVKSVINKVTIGGRGATPIDITDNTRQFTAIFTFKSGSSGSTVSGFNLKNAEVIINVYELSNLNQLTNYTITDNCFYNFYNGIRTWANVSFIGIYRNSFAAIKNNGVVSIQPSSSFGYIGISINANVNGTPYTISNVFIGSGMGLDKNVYYNNMAPYAVANCSVSGALGIVDKLSIRNNEYYMFGFVGSVQLNVKPNRCIVVNKDKSTPSVVNYDNINGVVNGKSSPNDIVEIYLKKYSNNANQVTYLIGTATTNAYGNWSLQRNSFINSQESIIENDILYSIADSSGYSSDFSNQYTVPCPTIDFILPIVVCKNANLTVPLIGFPAGGTFSGPGVTGNSFNPVNVTAGLVNITYTYTNVTGNCPTTVTKQILVPPLATILKNVISISASTATDAWPIDGSIQSSALGYGTSGVKFMWAPEEDYAYVDDRVQTNTLQTRTDGMLQNVPMFNWKITSANSCYANWRKVNTITQVNSGTGQLENRDILNNYSAALYGYNDQLSTAVVANASYKEISFDSFEEYTVGAGLNLTTLSKSNLTLVTTTPSSANLQQEINFEYDIIEARDKVVTIKYPYNSVAQLVGKRVGVFGAYLIDNGTKNIHGYYDVQSAVAGTVAGTVVITLADFSLTGLWNGKMSIATIISDPASTAKFIITSGANTITNSFAAGVQRKAHSGKQFLKITANANLEQVSMRLTPSKKYLISAWVSTDDVDADTYLSGTDRSIEISFIDAAGSVIAPVVSTDYTFLPSGFIIEGWQRVEGIVSVPANAVRFTLKFNTPSGKSTYIDDIRFFPFEGNMESYVYDKSSYKLVSVLDQNNYATYYYYDESGALYLVKKETELGVQTIQEVYKHSTEINKF